MSEAGGGEEIDHLVSGGDTYVGEAWGARQKRTILWSDPFSRLPRPGWYWGRNGAVAFENLSRHAEISEGGKV